MEFKIDPKLCKLIPNLQIGIIEYEKITIEDSPQMLKGKLQLFQESLFFDLEDKDINDYEEFQEWRTIFKKLGLDPNRNRNSAELLYKRISKQDYLPTMNSATDINHFFSMQYRIPIGIYDVNQLRGKIELRMGKPNESYLGLNGRECQVEKMIVSADNRGAFGNPVIDSRRTAIMSKTTAVLQIVYLPATMDKNNALMMLESLQNMFIQINGGEGKVSLITCS